MNLSKSLWVLFKYFIGIILNIALLCSVVICANSIKRGTDSSSHSANYVYVTTYGEKYHDINCYYIKDNYKKMTLEDAKDQGYSECSKCW